MGSMIVAAGFFCSIAAAWAVTVPCNVNADALAGTVGAGCVSTCTVRTDSGTCPSSLGCSGKFDGTETITDSRPKDYQVGLGSTGCSGAGICADYKDNTCEDCEDCSS
jgi:hypothetical protein